MAIRLSLLTSGANKVIITNIVNADFLQIVINYTTFYHLFRWNCFNFSCGFGYTFFLNKKKKKEKIAVLYGQK